MNRADAAKGAVLAAVLAAASPAHADDLFGTKRDTDTVTVRRSRERCLRQKVLVGGLFGGAVVAVGAGLYFHMQSRDASNEVAAIGESTALTWTSERQETYDAALRDRTRAIVGYSAGGALLIGAVVALILTDPGTEVVKVGPKQEPEPAAPAPVSFGLLPGGAYAEAGWRW
jgi:hypothetical protein